jgi:hypothetical protein
MSNLHASPAVSLKIVLNQRKLRSIIRLTGERNCLLICGFKGTNAAKQNGFSDRFGEQAKGGSFPVN